MSQLGVTPQEPSTLLVHITDKETEFSSLARLSGCHSYSTPRPSQPDQHSLQKQHPIQQQIKRLFTLTLSTSGPPTGGPERVVESPLLALPEAVLDCVVGFALRQGECNVRGATCCTTSEAAATMAASRATDLRALRASCWSLRILADRRIESLEVTWPMIMSCYGKSHRSSTAATSRFGIFEACCLGQSSDDSLQNDASSQENHHYPPHHSSSRGNTPTPSTPNRQDGSSRPGSRLQKANSGIQATGKSGSSLQYTNPTFHAVTSQSAGGGGLVAESRGGFGEGSHRRHWRDISCHFSEIHMLRLPNFQNVSWDQISAIEAFVRQVFPSLHHLRCLQFPGNLRRWGLPFIRQEHREAARRLMSALHCSSPNIQSVMMDPSSSNDARYFASGGDLARFFDLREIRVVTMGKKGSLNELRWTDADLLAVSNLPNLQSLSLLPFYALQISDLSPLTRCPALRLLALRSLAVVKPSMLAVLTQLQVLQLGHDHVNSVPLDLGQGVGRLRNLQALTLALHSANHLNLSAFGGLQHLHTLSLTAPRFALPMDLPSGSFPVLRNLRINLPLRWGVADVATAPITELLANLLPICGLRTLVLTGPGLVSVDGAMLVRCLMTQPPLDTLCLSHVRQIGLSDFETLIAYYATSLTDSRSPGLIMAGWAEHLIHLNTATDPHQVFTCPPDVIARHQLQHHHNHYTQAQSSHLRMVQDRSQRQPRHPSHQNLNNNQLTDAGMESIFGPPHKNTPLRIENPIVYLVPERLDPVLSVDYETQFPKSHASQVASSHGGSSMSHGVGVGVGGGGGRESSDAADAVSVCVVCSGVVIRQCCTMNTEPPTSETTPTAD